jgi:hypothetical protein
MSDYEKFCERVLLLAEVGMSLKDTYSKVREEFEGVTFEDVKYIWLQAAWVKYLSKVRKKIGHETARRMLNKIFKPSDPTAKDRIKQKLPEWLYESKEKAKI